MRRSADLLKDEILKGLPGNDTQVAAVLIIKVFSADKSLRRLCFT
jgi:hypothetical protein